MRTFTIEVGISFGKTGHEGYKFSAHAPDFGIVCDGRTSRQAVNNLLDIIMDRGIDALRSKMDEINHTTSPRP